MAIEDDGDSASGIQTIVTQTGAQLFGEAVDRGCCLVDLLNASLNCVCPGKGRCCALACLRTAEEIQIELNEEKKFE